MNNKSIILGKGFIGERIREEMDCLISDKKINTFSDIERIIKDYNPQILINCIGSTGAACVDDCENQIDKTLLANTFVPVILLEAALRYNLKLVHISSGCIYNFDYKNQLPLTENDPPDFFRLFYSRSKIYSEKVLLSLIDKTDILILRLRIPLDNRPHPKNILTKLLKYKKVIDVPNSVTYIPDFIKALMHLLEINAKGLFNVVNRGALRYPHLLDVYKNYVPSFDYEVVNLGDLNLTRTNLLLSTDKLEKTGFVIRDINGVLEECVQSYLSY